MYDDDDDPEVEAARNERILGATAHLLAAMGDEQAYLLLDDVDRLEFVWEDRGKVSGPDDPWGPRNVNEQVAYLEVKPYLSDRFDEQVLGRISPILRDVAGRRMETTIGYVETRLAIPEVDENWRDTLPSHVTKAGGNQGRKDRLDPTAPMVDDLTFSNAGEVTLYEALKRLQATRTEQDTFAIAPLPGVRIRAGHTWTPDFIIVGNGRAMVIELDGPHHGAGHRRADDDMRDHQWRRCGMQVRRIPVEFVRPERGQELEGFLKEIMTQALWS